eukprot:TRINITY_DN798_c0_g1_i3.p1 TRINITY_DN798_c0_g1~~TRINITY_DN798_c0_g1_i3.p1  ORF type:complete len:279 (+),score=69.64 TRINITY_DN798_c0_g1_i3:98-934(+)
MEATSPRVKRKTTTPFGTWEEGDGTLFWVRGANYKDDSEKIQALPSVMRLVHLDLYQGPKPQVHIFPIMRPNIPPNVGLVNEEREFHVVINFIVRGKDKSIDKKKKNHKTESWIMWVFIFALPKDARKDPENEKFFKCFDALINGDDKQRNHRVKFLACVTEGPWVVKAAIGGGKDGTHKGVVPTLVGEKVTTSYFKGDDYLEIDYNTAIDSVAVTSSKLAFQHSQKMVVDFGIVLQGESEDELPERVLGAARCSNFVIKEALVFPGTERGTYRFKDE